MTKCIEPEDSEIPFCKSNEEIDDFINTLVMETYGVFDTFDSKKRQDKPVF